MSDEDLNLQDEEGWTPLMYAVLRNEFDEAKRLLDKGANPDVENHDGETALFLAIENEHLRMIQLLCLYADINYSNKEGATALARSRYCRDKNISKLIESLGGVDSGPVPSLEKKDQIYLQMSQEYKLDGPKSPSEDKTLRLLQTVGMACFVDFYEHFRQPRIRTEDLIELIVSNRVSDRSARTKANTGIRIVREGRDLKALELISSAQRVGEESQRKAEHLLTKYFS